MVVWDGIKYSGRGGGIGGKAGLITDDNNYRVCVTI
jgi:hypothetical protein